MKIHAARTPRGPYPGTAVCAAQCENGAVTCRARRVVQRWCHPEIARRSVEAAGPERAYGNGHMPVSISKERKRQVARNAGWRRSARRLVLLFVGVSVCNPRAAPGTARPAVVVSREPVSVAVGRMRDR